MPQAGRTTAQGEIESDHVPNRVITTEQRGGGLSVVVVAVGALGPQISSRALFIIAQSVSSGFEVATPSHRGS